MTLMDTVIEALNVTQDSVLIVRADERLTQAQLDDLRAAFKPMFERGFKPAVIVSDGAFFLELERMPRFVLEQLRKEVDRLLTHGGATSDVKPEKP